MKMIGRGCCGDWAVLGVAGFALGLLGCGGGDSAPSGGASSDRDARETELAALFKAAGYADETITIMGNAPCM